MLQTARITDRLPLRSMTPANSFAVPRLTQIAGFGRSEVYRSRETIYSQEDPADLAYRVTAGMVRTTMLTSDGRRVIRGFHVPGEIFGVESGLTHTCWAEAICDTYLLRFDRYRLELLADTDRAVGHELLSWLLLSSDRAAQRISLLGRGNAVEKLAYFLIDIAERLSNNTRLDLPMSRSDMGDYLGLSSETVSRTFTTLRQQGLIAIDGHSIILQDVKALRVLAGD